MEHEDKMADSSGFEMKAHEQTYSGFLGLLKYGAIASFVVAAIVIFLIAS
jgi:Bacterial aa3 type cytochrome c oxidase subunit IV